MHSPAGAAVAGRSGAVLVLGSDTRSFLSVVRSLGRRGLRVHVAWCPPGSPALRSRYIERAHDIPPYDAADRSWLHAFVALLRRERFDLVVPCDDPTLLPLQLHRDELEPHGRLYLLGREAFAVTSSKLETSELARRVGVPTPRELVARRAEAADEVCDEVCAWSRFPVVLKPHSSYGVDDLTSKRFVRKVATAAELRSALGEMLSHGPVQVQEHATGAGVGVELLAADGDVLVAFQHLRVHEPPAGGGSSYRKSVALDPALLDAARRLVRALRYTGVAMVEFKVDARTGRWTLIEINGRFWGSLPLAVGAGADFPYYLYQLLVEGRRDFPAGYRVGLYARNWLKDAAWLRANAAASRNDSRLTRVPLWRVAAELVNVLTLRERSDTFVLDDPMPALAEIAAAARRLVGRRARAGRPGAAAPAVRADA
ncbi:MAG TPA: ATP-grasp domain-containing protein [Gemmatimonadaceae bacterium]|nr:ATP-grasp domain-containing protein [Gemmatimonadaceae bacterium]